jgi:hypothetical protein
VKNICAKEDCENSVNDNDIAVVQSPIGPVLVHLCVEHFSAMLHANMAIRVEKRDKEKAQHG